MINTRTIEANGICYLTHATFNAWILLMMITLQIQLSILKDKGEKPFIVYCFTIYRPPQLFPIKWISFGPVTKTKKTYNKSLDSS